MMVKAPSMGPAGTGPHDVRRIHPGSEIAINPRNLPATNASTSGVAGGLRGEANSVPDKMPHVDQVHVSTQVDLHSGQSISSGSCHGDWDRRATPLYSREDIKEQYCITNRQLDAVEKSGGGIFGCLSTRGPSPCSSTRTSILSACVRSVPSDENLCDAPYPRRSLQIMYRQPCPTYSRGFSRYDFNDETDWLESSYFRRRPKSFCTVPNPKTYIWLLEDEESTKLEGPRPILPPVPPPPILHGVATEKTKHVSFARSHTLTSFEVPRSRSPPRPHNQERLIDSQPTTQNVILPSANVEPRVLVLEKPPKRGITQATQTEILPIFRSRAPPVTLSPRTIHRVKMVSQGAQTNGIFNGRKLTKSYSEAGQLGTPLGGTHASSSSKEDIEHEPLHRTQSEEPPRSPFIAETPSPSFTTPIENRLLPNGDIDSPFKFPLHEQRQKSIELDDQEILIDFKPAPVSPDARALLSQMPQFSRKLLPLQKTLSDGEIRVERRELVSEAGEPTYPHTCRRNHQDPWGHPVKTLVQFSSTPEDLSLLRVAVQPDGYSEEEFHENLIRRGLFRKRSVSLEDSVQGPSSTDLIFPRSLPTSPTSPTLSAPQEILQSSKEKLPTNRRFLHIGKRHASGIGYGISIITGGTTTSPFASSDSLANDVTKDHSDGIWNESQATVLQADSLALLTPPSRRRHLLLLQHQQRSSMDTEALDPEEEIEIHPPSPRIRLEPTTSSQSLLTNIETSISFNDGKIRSGFHRVSPATSLSQVQSQSSLEFYLSLARTDSGGRTNTDLSETSTTEDYVTANTSTETGTTTGTSATTSSWTRPPQTSSATASVSAPPSTTATAAEGSSFESASSIYSLARSEAVIEEPCSPLAIQKEIEIPFILEASPSPARSTNSSSSGSYDLKDAMTEPIIQDLREMTPTSGHVSEGELDRDEGHRSSSGGYAESPPNLRIWNEEERRRRKKISLDFLNETTGTVSECATDPLYLDIAEVSSTPNRHRSRGKQTATKSPHKNNRKRDSIQMQLQQIQQQQQQQLNKNVQKEEWRMEQSEDGAHAPTSDDSSCSHHYHMYHHHHHHAHRDGSDAGRHRRTRDSPRRKQGGYISTRRRSNEDKNAAITGSLPRRKSHIADDICMSRLSPGRYQRNTGQNEYHTMIMDPQSPEAKLKALSAESLRSVSPGSDSVFYSEATDQPRAAISTTDAPHCHQCGREVSEEIVRPPAGFADSPEGHRTTTKYVPSHRLYRKFDKRYRSEDRGDRRHRRSSTSSRSDVRAKSEERVGSRSGSRSSLDNTIAGRKRLQARSTNASMEILTGRDDDDNYVEPYVSANWIYIGDFEESYVWRKSNNRGSDEEIAENIFHERRSSQESTESEQNFTKIYEGATHRMVHRKSSGEMYKRLKDKRFESDKKIIVKRESGGEFGFRIHGSKPVVVSVIEPDTPAENSGLEVGDIIISVNRINVMDASHSEIVKLAHSSSDVLELEVARTCDVLAPRMTRFRTEDGTEETFLCSGYLWRKSTSSSTDKWVRRWFALRHDNCLYYYKTDTDSQPVGAVMLLKYDVEPTYELRPYSFAILKKGATTLQLAADTEDAAVKWISIIREAVDKNNQIDTWLDASLRMKELPPCAIQKPDCSGNLSKPYVQTRRSSSPVGWSRRYCVLKDAALYFYDNEHADKAFGVACIHGFKVQSNTPTSGGRKHVFALVPPDPTQRSYTFAADNDIEKKRWLAALEYSIDRWVKIG